MRKPRVSAVLLVIFALILALPVVAEETKQAAKPIAEMSVNPAQVDWLPAVEYEHLVLTVAGPEGFYIHQELKPGQAPSLSLFQPNGERLSDGIYAYELRADAGGLSEGSLVQTGQLWVQEGNFVAKAPAQPSPPRERGPASKPPIRNITAQDSVIPDDLVVQGHACIGPVCTAVVPGDPGLTLKEDFGGPLQIKFDNIGCCHPSTIDWALQANDLLNATGDFLIRDLTYNKIPVRINPNAPDNALTIFSSSGNIGLGTSTPGARLHLYANATDDVFGSAGPNPVSPGPAFNFGYGGASFGRGAGFLNVRPDASAAAPNPSLRFLTGNVQRMIIDNEGFIGLGVANPTSPIHHSSGAILTAGGTWQNASSRESKQDISKLAADEAMTTLEGLDPVKFTYKVDPKERHIGFIAEDVPDLVASPDRKSLSPMDLVAVLTKVVQEQQATIEDLSTTLTELNERIGELEKKKD